MIIDAHSHIFPDNIAKAVLKKLQAGSNAGIFCEATEKALHQDLDYLRSVASAPLSPEQKGQDQGQGP